jgi:hypothetical protein
MADLFRPFPRARRQSNFRECVETRARRDAHLIEWLVIGFAVLSALIPFLLAAMW